MHSVVATCEAIMKRPWRGSKRLSAHQDGTCWSVTCSRMAVSAANPSGTSPSAACRWCGRRRSRGSPTWRWATCIAPHEVHPGVRYSGSLCRYSFSEQDHGKSVTLVAINARGGVATQEIPVDQRHGMRTLRGAFDELLKGAGSDAGRPDDFLRVRLTDTLPVFQAQAQLRTLYPNILELEYEASMAPVAGSAPDLADLSRRSEQDMLVRFLDRYPEELAAPLRKSAVSIMDEVIASKVDA